MTRLPKPVKASANATTPSWTAVTGAPSGAAISMPFDAQARRPPGSTKRRRTVPATGQSRSPRNGLSGRRGGRGGGRRRRRASRSDGLQLLLRGLQLAGELGVQIALAIDVANRVAAGRAARADLGARRGAPRRAACRGGGCRSSSVARVDVSSVERLLVRRDAIAIELRERGDGARRLPEAADVGGREQQPHVARLPELVHLDEPRLEIRPRGDVFGLQLRQTAR